MLSTYSTLAAGHSLPHAFITIHVAMAYHPKFSTEETETQFPEGTRKGKPQDLNWINSKAQTLAALLCHADH